MTNGIPTLGTYLFCLDNDKREAMHGLKPGILNRHLSQNGENVVIVGKVKYLHLLV